MNVPVSILNKRINTLKIQLVAHQQEVKQCENHITGYKNYIVTEEKHLEDLRFSIHQVEKELNELSALVIENTKDTPVSEKNVCQEAALYHGGVDGLELMEDPGK